jgi:hypothetical protein
MPNEISIEEARELARLTSEIVANVRFINEHCDSDSKLFLVLCSL